MLLDYMELNRMHGGVKINAYSFTYFIQLKFGFFILNVFLYIAKHLQDLKMCPLKMTCLSESCVLSQQNERFCGVG